MVRHPLTVGKHSAFFGLGNVAGRVLGSAQPASFTLDSQEIHVRKLMYIAGSRALDFEISHGLGSGHFSLEIGTGRIKKSFPIVNRGTRTVFRFSLQGLNWQLVDTAPVTLKRAGRPGRPTSLRATANGPSQVDLTWNAPEDDGAGRITGYKIEWEEQEVYFAKTLVEDTGNAKTTYGHTSQGPIPLKGGELYFYRVSAINSAGTGPATEWVEIVANTASPALGHCNPSDPDEFWCATMTVDTWSSTNANWFGFQTYGSDHGDLSPRMFAWQGTSYTVSQLIFEQAKQDLDFIEIRFRINPLGAATFYEQDYVLHVGNQRFPFQAASGFPGAGQRYHEWLDTDVDFLGMFSTGDQVIVKLTRTNHPPTSRDNRVYIEENTGHNFSRPEFPFSDEDQGDRLERVRIVTVPAARKGTLTLDGSAVSAGDTVTPSQLEAGLLRYSPPPWRFGRNLARFAFRVSDGKDESAADYTQAISVTRSSGGYHVGGGGKLSQKFTTGPNPAGYRLEDVTVGIIQGPPAVPAFSIYRPVSRLQSKPGTEKVLDLTGSVATTGDQTFTPAPGTPDSARILEPDTSYHVVFEAASNSPASVRLQQSTAPPT